MQMFGGERERRGGDPGEAGAHLRSAGAFEMSFPPRKGLGQGKETRRGSEARGMEGMECLEGVEGGGGSER